MVVFQKLEGKTTTLKFWNQKWEGKTTTLYFWNQKWEGKTTTLKFWNQKLEGKTTTPKNCVLTEFLHERSTIFFLVFSLIRFWILLRNVHGSPHVLWSSAACRNIVRRLWEEIPRQSKRWHCWKQMPCPCMWPKQFCSVQNGFGLTKLIWTWP